MFRRVNINRQKARQRFFRTGFKGTLVLALSSLGNTITIKSDILQYLATYGAAVHKYQTRLGIEMM